MNEMLTAAGVDMAAFVAFALVLLGILGLTALAFMVVLLCLRRAVARLTWNSAVRRIERRALHSAKP